jgi:hypothetical protein
MKNIDYKNIDDRLDLDNYITDIVLKFPKNETDSLFYIRVNSETGDLCFLEAGSYQHLGAALYTIALKNKEVLKELYYVIDEIESDPNNICNCN